VRWSGGQLSHDLVLSETTGDLGALHWVAAEGLLVGILDVRQTKRASTVLIARELGNGSCSVVLVVEFDNTGSTRTSVGLVLNLRALDFANGCEKLNQILVAGGPGKLSGGQSCENQRSPGPLLTLRT